MVNQALDTMGLRPAQTPVALLDGITRHPPEGRWFVDFARPHGFEAAVRWRGEGRLIPRGGGPIRLEEGLGRE